MYAYNVRNNEAHACIPVLPTEKQDPVTILCDAPVAPPLLYLPPPPTQVLKSTILIF